MNDGSEPSPTRQDRVFLLSPATLAGVRGRRILAGHGEAPFLAELHRGGTVPLGRLHAHISSLYFRGKRAYARRFGWRSQGPAALVVTPDRGLLSLYTRVGLTDLRAMAGTEIDPREPRYLEPLLATAGTLRESLHPGGRAILLGSIATGKYLDPLLEVLGDRLLFPSAFVGRGDMSRGGLLLRAVRTGEELAYTAAAGAERRGSRPPRLR